MTLQRTGSGDNETIQVFSDETIGDIKLRLRESKGWFTSHHTLVTAFGDRQLLEHETVGDIAKALDIHRTAEGEFVHLVVKLSDIQSMKVTTASGKTHQLGDTSPRTLPTSALTTSISASNLERLGSSTSLVPVSRSTAVDSAVMHLLIKRTAKVGWTHTRGSNFELSVSSDDTAETVTRRIEEATGVPAQSQQLIYRGEVLSADKPLMHYGITSGSVLELIAVEPASINGEIKIGSLASPSHELFANLQKARAGLAKGIAPKLSPAGTGGSYFICDEEGHNVAVFKPEDEEPLAVNNPKGMSCSPDGEGLKKGTKPGEGAVREVAAFVLDHNHFSGVPPTALVACQQQANVAGRVAEVTGQKIGSLQQFVEADGDCEERGSSAFPVSEVHKIAVLDLRLANTDRNGGNILARRVGNSWQLIPIDHGYCLPSSLQDISFEWQYWSQARRPFDGATLAYIRDLDAEQDLNLLAAHGLYIRPECASILRLSTMLLQRGAAAGLTAYDLASIMCREGLTKSPLEKLANRALELALAEEYGHEAAMLQRKTVPDATLMKHFEAVLDAYLEEFEGSD